MTKTIKPPLKTPFFEKKTDTEINNKIKDTKKDDNNKNKDDIKPADISYKTQNENVKNMKKEFLSKEQHEKNKLNRTDSINSSRKTEISVEAKARDKLTQSTIYIFKNVNIKFTVSGTWKFLRNEKNVDYNGHKDILLNGNHYLGELLGKVGQEIFLVTDNLEKKFKESGQLYLYPNIGEVAIEPSGSIKVKVLGGEEISQKKLVEDYEKKDFPSEKYSFFEVNATQLSEDYPLYLSKGDKIKFFVRGIWSFDKGSFVDCNGHSDLGNNNEGYNIGQLMGQVGDQTFAIKDNFSLISKDSGQLFLYPNVGQFELEPSGYIRVYVEGGKKFENAEELNNLMNKDVPKDSIQIKVEAHDKEQDFNIWVEKGKKIKFIVKGKWLVYEGMDKVDYNGSEEFGNPHYGFNIGALVGKVLGASQYFLVSDGLEYRSNVSGPLHFQMNNSKNVLSPRGSITVFIIGAEIRSSEQIEKSLGYDLKLLDTACNESYLSANEKRQFLVLNKIRTNPPRFADLYLIHRKNNPGYSKETYDELKSTKPMQPIYPSKALYKAARDHAMDMGHHGTEGHISTSGEDLSKRIERYGKFEITCGENCAYGHEDGATNVIQLLIDDGVVNRGHRKNILNPEYSVAGIAIYKHKTYKWNCVHDYAGGMR